ncbi:MAG: hypothetical protein NC086_09305 [Alistipes sp.]|nr:hypothetical protein [Alistipes sp.]
MAEKYQVGGYEFDTLEEAKEARKELAAVQYFTNKARGSSAETSCKMYQKMVEQKMFHTPVGNAFVKELGDYLVQHRFLQPADEEEKKLLEDAEREKRYKAAEEELKRTKSRLATSRIINVFLAAGVAAMIYIASTSSNVNILNYETALQDRYSVWEQQLKEKESRLKEREAAVKEKEAQFDITPETEKK